MIVPNSKRVPGHPFCYKCDFNTGYMCCYSLMTGLVGVEYYCYYYYEDYDKNMEAVKA